jgi:iron complex outermembrane recepter protein
MAQWSKAFGKSNAFSAGFDWRWVDGESQEGAYVAAVPTSISGVTQAATLSVQRFSGGSQQSLGAFVQDIFTPIDKLVLTLSARVDRWNNYNGHNLETTVATGLPTVNNRPSIPDTNDTVLSPHFGALYHASDRVSVWGAANSGFRAPTLTELYRQFSVGAVTTRPNALLAPERLFGGEAGINIAPARNVSVRVTWFDNRITNPVLNVTLNATTAMKQNVPETRVRGVQTDVDYRVGSSWRFSAGYIYDDAAVTDGGVANAVLVGKQLQQVTKNRGTLQAAYSNPKFATVALGVQFIGLTYNDDLNVNFIPVLTLADAGYAPNYPAGLPGYTVVDLSVSRNLGRNIQAFFGVQNLFDKVYFVQTNPSTIGTPRLINGGVRVHFSAR